MSRCAIKLERFTHFVALRHTVLLQIHHLKTGTSATCFPWFEAEKEIRGEDFSLVRWCQSGLEFLWFMYCMWRLFWDPQPHHSSSILSFSLSLAVQLMLSNILNDSKNYKKFQYDGEKYISVFCILQMIQNKLWHCTFATAWFLF